MLNLLISFDRQPEESVLRLLGYGPPDELTLLMNPRRNPNDINGDGVVDENDNPDPPTLGPGGIHQTHPDYQAPPPDDDDDDSGSSGSQPPSDPPSGQSPGGTWREESPGSNLWIYTPPGDDTNADTSDPATPFSHDPDDDVSYVVYGDGQVVSYQGGHTYRVNDDDLAVAVRTALDTGDASGLSSVVRVSVYDAAGHRSASNYEHHAGSEHHAESAEAVLSEFASVDEQEEWFRAQVRNLPADPAQAAQRLTELAVIAAGLGQYWSGRDAGAFVDGQGNPLAPQTYFANLSELFNASAAANQGIAQANAGLPSAPADPAVGRRFEADQGAIADRLSAADAIDDPAQRAAAQAAVAADLRDLQQRWADADTTGWTFTAVDGRSLTVADYWQEWADGVADAAGQNRDAAERNAASEQAVADFNAAVAPGGLSPAAYARLAEQWRHRPDNALVRIPVDDPALAEGGGAVYQTPAGYFARMSGDPALIAAERASAVLPGETGGVGAQAMAIDPVTGTLQVSPGAMSALAEAQQRRIDTRAEVERVIGPVEGAITQAHVDAANRAIEQQNQRLERQSTQEQERYDQAVNDFNADLSSVGTPNDEGFGPVGQSPAAEYARRAEQWRNRSDNDLVRIGMPDDEGFGQVIITPADYFAEQAILAQGQQQRLEAGEDTLAVIRGDYDRPLTVEDVAQAVIRIKNSSDSASTVAPLSSNQSDDLSAVAARQERVNRSIAQGELVTADDIRNQFPNLSDDEVNQQVVFQAALDIHSDYDLNQGSIGSQQFAAELRRRGMGPKESHQWSNWARNNGISTYSDLWAIAGSVAGGTIGGRVAGRLVPVLTTRVNPRLTTSVARGLIEEGGEEFGEVFADVIARVASGGSPAGALLDPATYAYAGGSILFSGVVEADAPARPRPDALPPGSAGNGAVYSTTGAAVDTATADEGNRLLDRWAASNSEYQRYIHESPPAGVDLATWNRRGAALARDVRTSGDALTRFRTDHADLAVGYKEGGGVSVVTANNLLTVVDPDGEVRVYALPPGEARFTVDGGGAADARYASEGIVGISSDDRIGGPDNSPDRSGMGGVYAGAGDHTTPLRGDGTADPSNGEPGSGIQDYTGYRPGGMGSAVPGVAGADIRHGIRRDTADSGYGGDVLRTSVPVATAPSLPEIAPVPTARLSKPLPEGRAEPSGRPEEDDGTETAPRRGTPGGRGAPPGTASPGSSQPSPQASPQTSPQASPQVSPQPSPIITPTRRPEERSETEPSPDARPGAPSTTPFAQPSPLTQPGITPSTLTTPTPSPLLQPSTSPGAAAQPTVAQPTPSPRPEGEPSPQPNPQPGPTPNVPTITPTTTTTPTLNPRQTPRRNRDRPDRERRRRELPNPVADDPNLHPNEVQFVDRNRHTVDLVTGEHTIEPLDDEQLRSIQVTGLGPRNPQGNVHLAGSVELEVERQHIVAESGDRRKDAGDPIDYRDINFAPGQGPARPSAQDLSGIQLPPSPGQLDYRDVNFAPGQGPARPSARDLSRIQLPDQRNQGSGQQLDYRDINFVDRQPGRSGSSKKSKSSGRGGNSGDGSNINYRPGQGPAPAANRRSANNQDTGLMNGGGAAGRRRSGGGRRRRDQDEDESGYRRPVIQVVLEG